MVGGYDPTPEYTDSNESYRDYDAFINALQDAGIDPENFEVQPFGRQPDGDLVGRKSGGIADAFTGSLAIGETYTSEWFDTDGFEAVEVFVSADVRSEVDGVRIEYADDIQATNPMVRGFRERTFTEDKAKKGSEDFQFPTNLDGARVKYTNNGETTSPDFATFTTLSPSLSLDSADYVSQSALGDTFVRVGSGENSQGVKISQPTSQFNDLEVVNRNTLVDLTSSFGTSIQTDEVISTGSGSITQDPDPQTGEIELSTGTTADSEIDLRSAEFGRYTPGFSAQAGMGIRIPSLPNEGRLEWGYFDENNGFLFGYDGDTDEFFVARKSDGTIVERVNQADFNLSDFEDVVERPFDLAEGQIFQINFSWYGFGIVVFSVVSQLSNVAGDVSRPRQETVNLHAIRVENETSTSDPNEPIRVRATNGANGDNNTIRVGGRQFSISGNTSAETRITAQSALNLSISDTAWTHLQSWERQNPADDSNARINIQGMDFGCDTTVRLAIVVDADVTGFTFNRPDLVASEETFLVYSNDGTFNGIGNGTKVWEGSIRVGSQEKAKVLNPEVDVRLGQNKIMSVIAQTDGASGTADLTTRMTEDF